ncbi:carboxypeptidase regulatory-like domain-containing protein [Methylosinus sp. Ce-a6]|uniref:carboxypeptidase regulatory-like domain-containing protein n=1 Tax=Methylosinus sp. Ce-a6 TaxID=2172005 RepID=UPI001FCEF51F|nr:carboxypeptidase regulatory-like domain-containing protein [Methylosinus sp. Ce-a6]
MPLRGEAATLAALFAVPGPFSMRLVVVCAALAPLALSACNSAAPDLRFDPAEAAFIRQEGKATIEGQAFLRDRQGHLNVRYAAGEVVRLIPATAYAQARFAQFYGTRKFIPALFMPTPTQEAEYAAYTRTTKAGATGRFAFDKVAPGRYLVTTQLTWVPKGGLLSDGGAMYDEIVVTGKETDPIEVVLSGN